MFHFPTSPFRDTTLPFSPQMRKRCVSSPKRCVASAILTKSTLLLFFGDGRLELAGEPAGILNAAWLIFLRPISSSPGFEVLLKRAGTVSLGFAWGIHGLGSLFLKLALGCLLTVSLFRIIAGRRGTSSRIVPLVAWLDSLFNTVLSDSSTGLICTQVSFGEKSKSEPESSSSLGIKSSAGCTFVLDPYTGLLGRPIGPLRTCGWVLFKGLNSAPLRMSASGSLAWSSTSQMA